MPSQIDFDAAQQLPPAVSEQFSDIIFRYQIAPEALLEELGPYYPQVVDTQYSILHAPLSSGLATVEEIGYSGVPKLFTFIDTVSLEASGILAAQLQPFLSLSGRGVLVGFLDSGIDYTHPAFRNADGTTRIVRIWDQSDQSGPAPDGLTYGTEYTQDDLNRALFSGDPYSVVPQRDETGHGTAVAGIACGSADSSADFTGAAPGSQLIVVKLKPAKQYLRNYFRVPDSAVTFQETDLMLGIRYMVAVSRSLRMPLVICMSLGTNQGGHTGNTPLEDVLTSAQFNTGVYAVTGTGNEAGMGHHYFGAMRRVGDSVEIELLVDEQTRGFTVEFWTDSPELYSIGFTSPLGETIQPVQPRNKTTREFNFLLENSRVFLTYVIVEMLSGAQLAMMRFLDPTPGIWRIRVVNNVFINGEFHLWMPVTGLVDPFIRFFSPNTDTTLVIPSCAASVISVSAYNAYNNSLFINSGRGYTRNNLIKPDFAAPGVDLTAPAAGGLSSPVLHSNLPVPAAFGTPPAAPDSSQTPPASGSLTATPRDDQSSPATGGIQAPVAGSLANPAADGYTTLTGSCAASAITAGATALLVESGLLQNPPRYFTTQEIKSIFLRGTKRSNIYSYPNREWGYGTLNVYGIFESFLQS